MRGGRREGAGRKPAGVRRVPFTVRIKEETREKIASMAKEGFSLSRAIEDLVERYK